MAERKELSVEKRAQIVISHKTGKHEIVFFIFVQILMACTVCQ